jgi:tetratricopeptide (TPR) repeat protein
MQRGELEHALVALEAALGLRREQGAGDPLDEAQLLSDIGVVQRRLGRNDEAVRNHEQALAAHEAALGPEHPAVAQTLSNLAAAYLAAKRKPEAERAARRSLAIDEAVRGPQHPRLASSLNNLSLILLQQDRHAEAEQAITRAVVIMEGADTQPHTLAIMVSNLALVQHQRHHYREAAQSHRKALALFEEAALDGHPDMAFKLALYGATLEALYELDEADAVLRRAVAMIEDASDEHASVKLEVYVPLGSVSAALGRWDDAIRYAEQALALERVVRIPRSHHAKLEFTLARARWAVPSTRARAIEHAREAARTSARLGSSYAPLRAEVAKWLDEHAPAGPPPE